MFVLLFSEFFGSWAFGMDQQRKGNNVNVFFCCNIDFLFNRSIWIFNVRCSPFIQHLKSRIIVILKLSRLISVNDENDHNIWRITRYYHLSCICWSFYPELSTTAGSDIFSTGGTRRGIKPSTQAAFRPLLNHSATGPQCCCLHISNSTDRLLHQTAAIICENKNDVSGFSWKIGLVLLSGSSVDNWEQVAG